MILKLRQKRKPNLQFLWVKFLPIFQSRQEEALLLVSAYFATVWIGRNVRHEILAEHLKYLSKRMGQIPEFAVYTIAGGIKRAFTRFGKWIRTFGKTNAIDASATNDPMLPGFAEFFIGECPSVQDRDIKQNMEVIVHDAEAADIHA